MGLKGKVSGRNMTHGVTKVTEGEYPMNVKAMEGGVVNQSLTFTVLVVNRFQMGCGLH